MSAGDSKRLTSATTVLCAKINANGTRPRQARLCSESIPDNRRPVTLWQTRPPSSRRVLWFRRRLALDRAFPRWVKLLTSLTNDVRDLEIALCFPQRFEL